METWVILLIVFGVLLLTGLGVGGYFLFYSNKTETKSFKNLTSATKSKKPDPQKCCWNRDIQSCSANSDCDSGGEGCISSGTITTKYGKVMCDTCESKGMVLSPDKTQCVKASTPAEDVMSRLRNQVRRR